MTGKCQAECAAWGKTQAAFWAVHTRTWHPSQMHHELQLNCCFYQGVGGGGGQSGKPQLGISAVSEAVPTTVFQGLRGLTLEINGKISVSKEVKQSE